MLPDSEARRAALVEFKKGRGSVFPDYEIPPNISVLSIPKKQQWLDNNPLERRYFRIQLTGEAATDASLQALALFPEVRDVWVISQSVTDEGVKALVSLQNLTSLVLYSPLVTYRSLAYIVALRNLKLLDLQGCREIDKLHAEIVVRRAFRCLEFWPPNPMRIDAMPQPTRRTVMAPLPTPATSRVIPNRVLSATLEADEEVEWIWSSVDGVSYVSGYKRIKVGQDKKSENR